MADKSSIEWTDATWNPTRGCDKIAQGCKNCYAETFAERFRGVPGHAYEQGFDPRLAPDQLDLPLRWKRPRRVFVDSMSDLFHEAFHFEYIAACFGVMAACPQHTFQILTKRPSRALEFFRWLEERDGLTARYYCHLLACDAIGRSIGSPATDWPLPNVWIGTSIANQGDADKNVPVLLQIPAAVRFLSVEPLLGPVAIRDHLMAGADPGRCANCGNGHGFTRCPNYGGIAPTRAESGCCEFRRQNFAIDWVIVGGESGPGARPCNVEWIRSIVQQCQAASVPVFVKQLGREIRVSRDEDLANWGIWIRYREDNDAIAVRTGHPKGGDWFEWPEDLRIREFPSRVPGDREALAGESMPGAADESAETSVAEVKA